MRKGADGARATLSSSVTSVPAALAGNALLAAAAAAAPSSARRVGSVGAAIPGAAIRCLTASSDAARLEIAAARMNARIFATLVKSCCSSGCVLAEDRESLKPTELAACKATRDKRNTDSKRPSTPPNAPRRVNVPVGGSLVIPCVVGWRSTVRNCARACCCADETQAADTSHAAPVAREHRGTREDRTTACW